MSRSKTTSIKRPPQRPAAEDGTSALSDVSRSIPSNRRVFRRPKVALFAGVGMLAVLAAIAAALVVLPVGTWRDQDDDLVARTEQLDALRRVNGQLAAEVDRLKTDDGVREAAREEIGYVEFGEERSSILPHAPLPHQLPDGWPYNIVTDILVVRGVVFAEPALEGTPGEGADPLDDALDDVEEPAPTAEPVTGQVTEPTPAATVAPAPEVSPAPAPGSTAEPSTSTTD